MPGTGSKDMLSGTRFRKLPPQPIRKFLYLEQGSGGVIEPCAPLGMDYPIIRCDLKVPADDQVTDQRHIKLTVPRFTKRLPFGRKTEFDQRHIRGVAQVDLIDPFLIIGWDIKIAAPDTALYHALRIGTKLPASHIHELRMDSIH